MVYTLKTRNQDPQQLVQQKNPKHYEKSNLPSTLVAMLGNRQIHRTTEREKG